MHPCVTSLLRDNGYKVTPQRLAIYHILANTTAHPSAEMIYDKLRDDYPTMSLATVYKTVEIFKTLNLIQILNVGEDSFRYDADTSNHAHVRCLKCNKVEDLHGVDSKGFIDKVISHSKYRLYGQQFYFFGVCPSCHEAEEIKNHAFEQ